MDIIADYSDLTFIPNDYFAYDAARELINYDHTLLDSDEGRLSILHEIAHALLGHFQYGSDFELLLMEIDAWQLTRRLVKKYHLTLDEDFIKHCIDSYDRWLSARSTCPDCKNFCLEERSLCFHCFHCGASWRVNDSKQRRVIRKKIHVKQKAPR